MIRYQIMDAAHPLPTSLHGGPIPLSQFENADAPPAYVETVSDIPYGTVVKTLQGISGRYGTCGVMAIDDDMVLGKIRAYPQALVDRVTYPCVQQEAAIRPVVDLDLSTLPTLNECPVLHIYCMQVASAYSGHSIVGAMLDALIEQAKDAGWQELRARAISSIPPLMNWCGQLSRGALAKRGFRVIGSSISPGLCEGVVSQRAGHHGESVRAQWEPFAHLSDDEAAQVFEMSLDLVLHCDAPDGQYD